MFKVIFDLVRLGIHPALHIADMAVCAVPEHALIVYQPGLVIPMKILRHRLYILSRIGFVSTGPDQDARMVLIPLEHRLRPVKDSAPPLGKVSRHMTGWVACPHLLQEPWLSKLAHPSDRCRIHRTGDTTDFGLDNGMSLRH